MKLEMRAILERHIHVSVFDYYISQYLWNIDSDFKEAAQNGRLDTVQYLVSIGANVRVSDDYALRGAVGHGHLDTAKYLVSIGANAHTCRYGNTILCATTCGHHNTLDYLISIGVIKDTTDWFNLVYNNYHNN